MAAETIVRRSSNFIRGLGPRGWVELFVWVNLAFLSGDIYLAHSVNRFANWAEWTPLVFSIVAPLLLLAAWMIGGTEPRRGWARLIGLLVGWSAIAVGVTGLLLHLHSQFFVQQTLKSLVYTAPFAAPLAYAGLGLLLIMNRMVDPQTPQWSGWIMILTAAGFAGNFVLSLADHAENAFFERSEWIPVAAAAFAISFLLAPFMVRVNGRFLWIGALVMALEIAVGLLGFGLHLRADLRGPSPELRDNFIFGAPAFAPLLFPNLALLGCIGLWAMSAWIDRPSQDRSSIN